jgi:predicted Zn-dependent protease
MHGHVAGVIGFGAGLPHTMRLAETVPELGTPFVFYGGAGVLDFNYEEVRALDRSLDALGVVHRIEFYDGPHAWPPDEVFDRAVAWVVLQAMKSGLRPRRQEWIEAEFRRRSAAAAAAAENGDALTAWELYRSAAGDFSGLQDVGGLEARAAELGTSKAVRRAMRRQESLETEHREWVGRLRAFLDDYRTADPLPKHKDAVYRLRIAALQRQADRAPDAPGGLSARRRLELAFVQTSFYQPRDYLRAGDPRRAEGVLQIAAAIRPGDPNVCLQLARAQAQLGRTAAALENLRCAADSGRLGPDRIDADELLAPLRDEPGYREIQERLRGDSG